MKVLEEEGLEVSISSIRADSLTEELVSSLRRGGHRTLTVAPEAGTERLRHVIRKDISDAQIYEACALVRAHGIPNLKCYFMIGLPTETDEDIEAIPALATRLLERLRVPSGQGEPFGRLTLSISSFVPKPWTPFQWVAFDPVNRLEAKLRSIKAGVRRLHNVRVLHENPRERSSRRSWPAGIAGSRTSSRRPRASRVTGGPRSGSGAATPTSTRTASVRSARRCRGTTSTSACGRPAWSASTSARGCRRSLHRSADCGGGRAMTQPEGSRVDVREHGANQQTSTRRLYMQLQAFGDCDDPKRLAGALERARIEGVLYADAADPLGVAVLGIAEDPAFFVGRWRELLGTETFLGLRRKPELTMFGRTYSSGFETDL
jgi:hypothetical protein